MLPPALFERIFSLLDPESSVCLGLTRRSFYALHKQLQPKLPIGLPWEYGRYYNVWKRLDENWRNVYPLWVLLSEWHSPSYYYCQKTEKFQKRLDGPQPEGLIEFGSREWEIACSVSFERFQYNINRDKKIMRKNEAVKLYHQRLLLEPHHSLCTTRVRFHLDRDESRFPAMQLLPSKDRPRPTKSLLRGSLKGNLEQIEPFRCFTDYDEALFNEVEDVLEDHLERGKKYQELVVKRRRPSGKRKRKIANVETSNKRPCTRSSRLLDK
jgi:hypothetical protein